MSVDSTTNNFFYYITVHVLKIKVNSEAIVKGTNCTSIKVILKGVDDKQNKLVINQILMIPSFVSQEEFV